MYELFTKRSSQIIIIVVVIFIILWAIQGVWGVICCIRQWRKVIV